MSDTEFETDQCPSPRENDRLVAHEEAETTLFDSYQSGRMAHAWLICGPQGIGKATLAYRFARFLLVKSQEAVDGMNGGGLFGTEPALFEADTINPSPLYVSPEHPVFRRVAASGHADLITVERTPNDKGKMRNEIVIDDVREVGSFFSLTAAEGGWRIVIIDAADQMNRNAANAVLKVLEEPPARTILLLVCHNPGRLLPTIRSRCRHLVLTAPTMETTASIARSYASELAEDEALMLSNFCEGRVGRVLAMSEEGGLDLYRELIKIFSALPNLDVAELHRFAGQIGKADADTAYRTSIELFRGWLHRIIMSIAMEKSGEKTISNTELVSSLSEEDKILVSRLSETGNLDRWLQVWDNIQLMFTKADSINLERKQVILNAFFAIEEVARS